MAEVALTVIGNSVAALLAAALAAHEGVATALVVTGFEGFDDSFCERDLLLEGGLLVSDGDRPDGPVQTVMQRLGIPLDIVPVHEPTRFATDAGSVRLGPTFAQLESDLAAAFPADRHAVAALIAQITQWAAMWEEAGARWGWAEPEPHWLTPGGREGEPPPGTLTLDASRLRPKALAKLAKRPFARVLASHDLSNEQVRFWEALLTLRTGHLPLAIDCLSVSQLLSRDLRGLGAIAGGLDPFRHRLMDYLRGHSNCLVVHGDVDRLRIRPERPVQVRIEEAGEWASAQVVCDRAALLWQAMPLEGEGVDLIALPGAQRFPYVVGLLVGLHVPAEEPFDSGQTWWVPRPELPPTGVNGFWITHVPPEGTLPNPADIRIAAIHSALLESQLVDPAGRFYDMEDLTRRLWNAARRRDEHLGYPLEAFHAVVPERVAPHGGQRTLLPDPRPAVAPFTQQSRLGQVPRCWWLERPQHPLHDLRGEFIQARRLIERILEPTPLERWVDEVRGIFAPP